MRFGGLGGWEWLILLVIVLLVIGPGRIAKIASELGQSIRNFRDGLSGDKKSDSADENKKE